MSSLPLIFLLGQNVETSVEVINPDDIHKDCMELYTETQIWTHTHMSQLNEDWLFRYSFRKIKTRLTRQEAQYRKVQ